MNHAAQCISCMPHAMQAVRIHMDNLAYDLLGDSKAPNLILRLNLLKQIRAKFERLAVCGNFWWCT